MPNATAPLSSEAIIAELGYTPADDDLIVHLSGNESIAGVKTFTDNVGFATITAGLWNGTAIGDAYIASAAVWNAKENAANKATNFVTVNDTLYPSVQAVKAYADALVVGLLDDRGNFDASGNVFPSSGGSGSAGAILKGDLWLISVAGTLGGTLVAMGDQVRALTDTPGQTASNWAISEANIGYVSENVANKATSFSTLNNTLYPTTQAVANYAQPLNANLSTFAGITPSANVQTLLGAANYTAFKTSLSLNDVENTALSTWAGSSNVTTLGTISTGVWNGTDIALTNIAAASSASKLLGRGDSGAGDFQEITIGSGLTMTGTTLSASGGASPGGSDGDYQVKSGSSLAAGVIAQGANGRVIVTPTAASSGVQPYLRIVTPVDTGQTVDTEFPGIVFGGNSSGATVTRTGADGTTITTQREYVFVAPTYAFAGATILTNAATVAINASPIAGANATITNPYALFVQAGVAKFLGGISSNGAGVQSERVGKSATAGGSFASAFGDSAAAGGDQSVAIGFSSTVNGGCTGGIAIGPSAGLGANTNASIAIGLNAATTATTATNSIALGTGAVTKTANTVVFGGSSQPINILHGGKGEDHATPVQFMISGTHGLGSNITAGDLALQAGLPTGSGSGGAIIFKGALAGASSSTRQTAEEWARISSIGVLSFPATMTAGGTAGAQTINKVSGSVNFAASATSLVVTSNKVSANSIVIPVVMTNDATMKGATAEVSAGSFTLRPDAAPTGEVKVGFVVLNL